MPQKPTRIRKAPELNIKPETKPVRFGARVKDYMGMTFIDFLNFISTLWSLCQDRYEVVPRTNGSLRNKHFRD